MEDDESSVTAESELPELSESLVAVKEPMSPLARDLRSYIKMRGPITIHDYMAQALNHSAFGYYQYKSEKIGTQGDFITSPEISQLFGECVAVWCVSVWKSLGSPKAIKIVELGPGKGTLAKVRWFDSFYVPSLLSESAKQAAINHGLRYSNNDLYIDVYLYIY
jgi:hypothetical protein